MAEVAATQYGVVTLRQLERCGLGRQAIRNRVAAGRLRRLWQGVYAFGHAELRLQGRLLAAVLACGPDAVLSHYAAADHHGLRPSARTAIDVTVASRGGRVRRPGIELHRVRQLDPRDVANVDGIPTTSVARTLIDLAGVAPPRTIERSLEQAHVLRLLTAGALDDALSRAAGRRTEPLLDLMRERRPSTVTAPSWKSASWPYAVMPACLNRR